MEIKDRYAKHRITLSIKPTNLPELIAKTKHGPVNIFILNSLHNANGNNFYQAHV